MTGALTTINTDVNIDNMAHYSLTVYTVYNCKYNVYLYTCIHVANYVIELLNCSHSERRMNTLHV